MPQHKSCKKRLKTDAVRRERNRSARSVLRGELRKYRELSADDRKTAYSRLMSTLDKASTKGIISENRAARLKSRLAPAATA
ncbi:MAG: 30S ribosomal protein S20 [Candidatus Krumholzibacteriota bacterium]|nr:30S ribosomal protein S20 [Candidatus Krumholzibacteriota bacterium]